MLKLHSKILQRYFGTTLKSKLRTHKGWEGIIVETQNIPKPISTSTTSKCKQWRLQITLHKKLK